MYNYYNKGIPKPDYVFISSFIDFKNGIDLYMFFIKHNKDFCSFYYVCLHYYKLNITVVNSNYYLYLINTPDNLLKSFCFEQMACYYAYSYDRIFTGNRDVSNEVMYIHSSNGYKYELVTLYHELGKRFVWYCMKYMYTQYVEHFKNLSITGEAYKKYTIRVKDRNLELDFFLSFTDFKNLLTKELFDLDTGDLIKYGKDMYIFTLFNIYLFNSNSKKIKEYNDNLLNIEMKVECKCLVNVIKPNIDRLGMYYPSRNEMYKSIIHLD